ncbi:hypothetical protein NMG60_11002664 [Bertholletia excelsa]
MKFGKSLRNEIAQALPEWEGEFISYKELKQQLNVIVRQQTQLLTAGRRNNTGQESRSGFLELLNSELEKVNAFFIDKEEEFIIRIKEMKDRVARPESSGELTQIKLDLLDFHGEMVSLLRYSVLNFTGFTKIVKKHNKKIGTVFHITFMAMVLQQPFFTTELICNLLQECEALLNYIFLSNSP